LINGDPFLLQNGDPLMVNTPVTSPASIAIGSIVQQVRPEGVVAVGRISSRDVTNDAVTYSAYLDAILLENNVTPANYTGAIRNTLLSDLAESVLSGWRTLRADLERPQSSTNVDR